MTVPSSRKVSWLLVAALVLHGCATRPETNSSARAVSAEYGAFRRVLFDPGGTFVAAHEAVRNRLYVFRASDLRLVDDAKLQRQADAPLFSPNASHIATDSVTHDTVDIWKVGSHDIAASVNCGSTKILGHAFLAHHKEYVVLCGDGRLRRWETQTWRMQSDQAAPAFWPSLDVDKYTPVQFSADGGTLIVPAEGRIVLWSVENGLTRSVPKHCKAFSRFAIDPGLRYIAVPCQDDWGLGIKVWSLESGQPISLHDSKFGFMRYLVVADFDHATSLAFSPDGRYLAVTLTSSGFIRRSPETRLWDTVSGAIEWSYQPAHAAEWVSLPVAFSPDGSILAIGGHRVRLFNLGSLLRAK